MDKYYVLMEPDEQVTCIDLKKPNTYLLTKPVLELGGS